MTDTVSSKRITIGLVWHQMNSDNLGVGALTVSNIAVLRRAAETLGLEPHFVIMGWKDPRPWYEVSDDVENVPLRLRHLPAPGGPLGTALSRVDIVFDIGGGDSFTDIYGARRFFTIWVTKIRAWMKRRPLILSPQTVGPFNTWLARALARHAMGFSRAVVTRDVPSTQFLKDMGVKGNILEATDVAMRLPYEAPEPYTGDKVRVGINVSGLLMSGGYTQSNQFGLKADYGELVRDIIRYFQGIENVELHIVGHVQSEIQPLEDDHRAGQKLAEEFPGTIVSPFFNSPSEAKTYIAGLDFFMAARMHAAIAAFSSGVPVVPMAYSRKFIGVFGTLGYTHVADCKEDTADEILARIKDGFERRDVLTAETAVAMENVNQRLDAYEALAASEMTRALKIK